MADDLPAFEIFDALDCRGRDQPIVPIVLRLGKMG
jgi:hypothetical protein